jgi:CxxC-x17-CxxC domain-containing protein
MNDFKKSGGFRSGGKNQNFMRRDSDRRDFNKQMYPATCDQCHKQCEVPFRPTGEKPVYCRDCFSSKRESLSHSFSQKGPSSSSNFSRRDSAPASSSSSDRRIDDLKRQLDGMNSKLDVLIKLIQKDNSTPAAATFQETKSEPVKITSPAKKPSPVVNKTEKKVVPKKKPTKKKK